jgi:hypothetical protein
MQALLLVAEHDGPMMFARIGVMRALNRHVEHVFDPSRERQALGTPQAGAGSMTEARKARIVPAGQPASPTVLNRL